MSDQETPARDRRAAIVCSHIALENAPIMRAVRDKPTMAADSGWQFLCATPANEEASSAKVWLVCEVLDQDTSLKPFINFPFGTVLTRKTKLDAWIVSQGDCKS
jgi:hypothetical protein